MEAICSFSLIRNFLSNKIFQCVRHALSNMGMISYGSLLSLPLQISRLHTFPHLPSPSSMKDSQWPAYNIWQGRLLNFPFLLNKITNERVGDWYAYAKWQTIIMLPNLTCHCQIDCRAFVHFFFTLFPTGLLLEQVILKTTLASINWTSQKAKDANCSLTSSLCLIQGLIYTSFIPALPNFFPLFCMSVLFP